MAGAVSAGAYTAGVVDYLLEALEDWESRRGQPGVPVHKVIIEALGGASAGGMTGVITASALNNHLQPVSTADPEDLLKPRPENKLYNTWVDLIADDMFLELLKTDDIGYGKIHSLLNSSFIDVLSERAIKVDAKNWIERPFINN